MVAGDIPNLRLGANLWDLRKRLAPAQAARASYETEPGVEARRCFVDGVCEHRADAGLFGDQQGASDGVPEQAGADGAALIRS